MLSIPVSASSLLTHPPLAKTSCCARVAHGITSTTTAEAKCTNSLMGLLESKLDDDNPRMTEVKKRWKCPSDRELTLRAKLNSGWSVHSQDYFQKSEQIKTPELRSIEYVLERARRLDFCERERIGRMVCRLENMKKNAVGDGKKTCSMCAIAFGFFRSSSVCCVDCSMAVCEKCRIDICDANQETCILCKICAENRELWKKSGGWFYGQVLSQTELLRNDEEDEDSLNCSKTYNTWEHTRPDIVRLESFEPPEVNLNESPLYKNWAVSSSPDLKSLDENATFFDGRLDKLRKRSDVVDKSQMYRLSDLEIPNSKLSVSCPSLQMQELAEAEKQKRHRRRLLTPAIRVMEKITRHYKH